MMAAVTVVISVMGSVVVAMSMITMVAALMMYFMLGSITVKFFEERYSCFG